MKTNEIYVSNEGTGREDALSEAEKYADYQLITKGLVNILNAFFAHSAHSAS